MTIGTFWAKIAVAETAVSQEVPMKSIIQVAEAMRTVP
jgi:hypothetical protein